MKKPAAITPILKSMSQKLGLEKEMILYRLKKNWPDFVGQTLSEHTTPERLKFRALTLRVDGPTWMHELSFLKKDILKKINTQLGKNWVQTLHLKVGSSLPQNPLQKNVRKPSNKALSAQSKAILQEALLCVEDTPLKKVIQQAMKRHLQNEEGR